MMTIRCLAAMFAVVMPALLGCGGGAATTTPPTPFEIQGKWLYLGPSPSDGAHDLTVASGSGGGNGSMAYAAIDDAWSSNWTVKTYDNGLHHFQVTFASGSGTYLPVGQNMSGTYDLSGTILAVQLANGLASYPTLQSPPNCTAETSGTPLPDCRLYVKQD
jgi:hypothetical protein